MQMGMKLFWPIDYAIHIKFVGVQRKTLIFVSCWRNKLSVFFLSEAEVEPFLERKGYDVAFALKIMKVIPYRLF